MSAFFALLGLQFIMNHGNMLVRVCFSGNAFKLKPHRRDFQPAGKRRYDIKLFFSGTQHKVYRLNFKNPNVSPIGRLNNTVLEALNRNEVLNELQLFRFFCPFSLPSCLFSFFGAALGHIYIPPFCNVIFSCLQNTV